MRTYAASHVGRLIAIVVALLVAAMAVPVNGAMAHDGSEWVNKSFSKSSEFKNNARSSGLGSSLEASRRGRNKSAKVTSRSNDNDAPKSRQRWSRSGGGGGNVNWVASSSCLNSTLRGIVNNIASSYGSVTVSSTCRSHAHNRRVGGAPRSQHLSGDAVDFRVHGNWRGALSQLRGHWGGFSHYGGGLFHVDTGPKRSW